jgi:hypothetical protein
MSWLAAGAGIVGNVLGANAAKKAAKQADARLVEGRNYAINQSGLTDYAQQGQQAAGVQAGLLGVGGDPAAAQAGFDNYLNSTGYRFNLDQGQKAITGSAAAKGLLKSGATAKALAKYGQNIGSDYFNTYLNQVGGVANRGLSASDSLARTVTGVGGQQAQVAQQAGSDIGNAYASTGSLIGKVFGYDAGGRG